MSLASSEATLGVIEELRALLGERLSTADAVRDAHGRDESWHPTEAPDAVAFAQSTEEVSAIVKICHAAGTPIIPYGAGTSVDTNGTIFFSIPTKKGQPKKFSFHDDG